MKGSVHGSHASSPFHLFNRHIQSQPDRRIHDKPQIS